MALKKITETDLAGKGVCGQADVPGLSAAEMQAKVEEIVRDVVIPAMNSNSEEIESEYATKEELGDVVLASGAVTSVFGRAGAVIAHAGDYTAEQVGAAAKIHAARHKTGGADAIAPADIGAAKAAHAHGNLTSAGAIGMAKGLLVVTGSSGVLTTESKAASGFAFKPQQEIYSGDADIELEDNIEYVITNAGEVNIYGGPVSCHGFITFGSAAPAVVTENFSASAGDDITAAAANEVWEFDCLDGYVIWKNWSAAQ